METLKKFGWVIGGVAALIVFACCGVATAAGAEDMYDRTPRAGLLLTLTLVAAGLVTLGWRAWLHRRAKRETAAWAVWEEIPAQGPWPWHSMLHRIPLLTMTTARVNNVDGLRVVAGEVVWSGEPLPRMVEAQGNGVFATVQLPRHLPPMTVLPRAQPRSKTFEGRFDLVGIPGLVGEVLRHVHVEGTVPPWKSENGELYVVVRVEEPVRPRHIEDIARRATWIVRLLLLEEARRSAPEAP